MAFARPCRKSGSTDYQSTALVTVLCGTRQSYFLLSLLLAPSFSPISERTHYNAPAESTSTYEDELQSDQSNGSHMPPSPFAFTANIVPMENAWYAPGKGMIQGRTSMLTTPSQQAERLALNSTTQSESIIVQSSEAEIA
ncbi:hypothetical protein B0H14DRAFT_2587809 [Mycena olivaceomarginata]|nr:hypothetical protein B0H14DRAFT_2587809 [Mycena olivaceomarginata]